MLPERVLVYIAEGYPRPDFQIGEEEYIYVRKGMVAQRALRYDEIGSDCILMLDDDVLLAPNSAEKLLLAMQENNADCVGADVFRNHLMPLKTKLFAAASNLVLPHNGSKWAFRVCRNGSFTYNAHPHKAYYRSQSCGGPAMLWRKQAFLNLHIEDELWLDSLGFAYGDDMLETYKLHANGGHLGVLYDAGIVNQDPGTASGGYKKSADRLRIRTQAMYMIWWRSIYRNGADTAWTRSLAVAAFGLKTAWMLLCLIIASPFMKLEHAVPSYIEGMKEGRKSVRSADFKSLRPYIA